MNGKKFILILVIKITEKRFANHDGTIIDNKREQLISTDEIVEKLNELSDEKGELKKLLECSREEANDYCEELMEKDEFIRLYKRQRDDALKKNKQLKSEIQQIKTKIRKGGILK